MNAQRATLQDAESHEVADGRTTLCRDRDAARAQRIGEGPGSIADERGFFLGFGEMHRERQAFHLREGGYGLVPRGTDCVRRARPDSEPPPWRAPTLPRSHPPLH